MANTDAAATKVVQPSSKLAKQTPAAATAAGAGGGTAPASAALTAAAGGPSLEAPKAVATAAAAALGKPTPDAGNPLLAPKRNQSRSARRKATKRMLRRTGVLPYTGGVCGLGFCPLQVGASRRNGLFFLLLVGTAPPGLLPFPPFHI